MALGQTWLAHMKELSTRILILVLTQKWWSAPKWLLPRTLQLWCRKRASNVTLVPRVILIRSNILSVEEAITLFGITITKESWLSFGLCYLVIVVQSFLSLGLIKFQPTRELQRFMPSAPRKPAQFLEKCIKLHRGTLGQKVNTYQTLSNSDVLPCGWSSEGP